MGSSWCSETKCCHLSLFLLGRLLEMLGVCSGVLCVSITFEDVFDTHSTLFRSTNVGLFSIHSKSGPGEFLSFPLNESSVILISDTHSFYRHNDCITGQFSLLWLTLRHDWETVTRGLWRCRYNGRKAMIMEKIISAAQSFHLQLNGVTFLAADGSRSCERPWAVCLQVHATLAVRMRLPRKTKKISRPSSESLALFVYFSSYFATTPATSLLLPLTSKESIVIFDLFFFFLFIIFFVSPWDWIQDNNRSRASLTRLAVLFYVCFWSLDWVQLFGLTSEWARPHAQQMWTAGVFGRRSFHCLSEYRPVFGSVLDKTHRENCLFWVPKTCLFILLFRLNWDCRLLYRNRFPLFQFVGAYFRLRKSMKSNAIRRASMTGEQK